MENFAQLTDMEIVEYLSQDYKMPKIGSVNGFGTDLMGKLSENRENTYSFKMYCFIFAFLPVYLRSIYYVQVNGRKVHSLGYISKRDFKRIFGAKLYKRLVLSVAWDYVFELLFVLAVLGAAIAYVFYRKYYLHG